MEITESVETHYGIGKRLEAMLDALGAMGKDLERLTPAALSPVDAFPIRGREATLPDRP